jgi:fructokinase
MAGVLNWLHEHDVLQPGKLKTLGSEQLAEMLRFGAVVAGINCSRKGCKPPTRAEVDGVLTS